MGREAFPDSTLFCGLEHMSTLPTLPPPLHIHPPQVVQRVPLPPPSPATTEEFYAIFTDPSLHIALPTTEADMAEKLTESEEDPDLLDDWDNQWLHPNSPDPDLIEDFGDACRNYWSTK